jgi:hypothetical protein
VTTELDPDCPDCATRAEAQACFLAPRLRIRTRTGWTATASAARRDESPPRPPGPQTRWATARGRQLPPPAPAPVEFDRAAHFRKIASYGGVATVATRGTHHTRVIRQTRARVTIERHGGPVTGRRCERRFHRTHESEAIRAGVVTTESGIMTGAPYRAIAADHRVFAGTGLRDGDRFGTESLHDRCHGGASGLETDKTNPSSPANTILLANGLSPEDGGAEMVTHETASGGMVVSVGSIIYPASVLVDPTISRITATLVARFLR